MLLKDLTTLTASLASGTLFHVEKSGKAYNIDYTKLAKAIVEEYNGSTLGGSAQTVQAAIGALNSMILGYVGKETLTNSTVYSVYGWITGSKKTLFLSIPLNLTNDVSTATFTSLKVGLRLSTGGYAFGADNTNVTSMITKTVVNKREGVLRVEITSDTDICDTNNICCAGTANFTVTFS